VRVGVREGIRGRGRERERGRQHTVAGKVIALQMVKILICCFLTVLYLYRFSQDQIVKIKFFGFLYLDLLKLVVPFIEKDIFSVQIV